MNDFFPVNMNFVCVERRHVMFRRHARGQNVGRRQLGHRGPRFDGITRIESNRFKRQGRSLATYVPLIRHFNVLHSAYRYTKMNWLRAHEHSTA